MPVSGELQLIRDGCCEFTTQRPMASLFNHRVPVLAVLFLLTDGKGHQFLTGASDSRRHTGEVSLLTSRVDGYDALLTINSLCIVLIEA
jgi:hypothetical protein